MTITTNNPVYGNIFFNGRTVADLRAVKANRIKAGYSAIVQSRTQLGDGYGGLYAWAPLSTADDDNASVIKPDGKLVAGRWLLVAGGPANTSTPIPGPVATADVVYVDSFRSPGDTTDTAAFKAAAIYANANNKPIVRFARGKGSRPDGHYTVGVMGQNADPSDRGNLRSNLVIDCDPGTIIHKDETKAYVFFCNPVGIGNGTQNTKDWTAVDAVQNVTFRGLTIKSDVAIYGFSEQEALFHLNAVKNITIEGCSLIGWRGDAVYLGAGDIGGGGQNRHNTMVRIRDNYMDGVNKNNRNPVSLQDCDGFWMERNYVVNACKPGGGVAKPTTDPFDPNSGLQMPASLIDLEPNSFILDPIVRNVWILDNIAVNGGGDGVNIFLRYNDGIPNPEQNIVVRGNTFTGLRSGWSTFFEPGAEKAYALQIERNVVRSCRQMFLYLRGDNIDTDNNIFEDCADFGEVGYEFGPGSIDPVSNFRFRGNFVKRCGINGVGAFVIGAIQNGEISGNTFLDNSGYAFTFRKPGVTRNLTIHSNHFLPATTTYGGGTAPSKVQTGAIGVLTFSGVPLIDYASCKEYGNHYHGLPNFGWQAEGAGVVSQPSTGKWKQGQTLVGNAPPRGEPLTFYCIRSAVGSGDGSTGNDRARWATVAAPGGIPDAADYTTAISVTTGATSDGKGKVVATLASQYAKGSYSGSGNTQQVFRFQGPSRGSEAVFVGWTDSSSAVGSLAQTDCKLGMWFQQGVLRPVVKGVAQPAMNPPQANDPSGAIRDCYINRQYIVRFLNAGATGSLAYVDPDTGAEVSLGTFSTGTGSTANIYPFVLLGSPNDQVRFVSTASG